ncbi:hypothetical protein K435DRAFT_647075 [Dendrothele bispora CBS 962.96]|uniref:Uncharacterized protein n=1 Tax=Dendrothele bispora (strain CBS 962.96) TaxID=1314807 RepID=A0A4S8MSK8_DENBC|nr:hypothetical protein K435DRAFT_647075 [Dendrothele bispora CBS 962.96]
MRTEVSLTRSIVKSKSRIPNLLRLKQKGPGRGGIYSKDARKLAREMVAAGCSRQKVGTLIKNVGATFGIEIKSTMSRCTVSRAVLEGGVAAKMQIGYEMLQTNACTISADSTSHRKQNYESRHIALRTPDYNSPQSRLCIDTSAIPRLRLLCVDATLDHTSEASVNGFLGNMDEISDLFNRSPLAKRLNLQFRIRHFLKILRGMNGDHANNEKSTAKGLQQAKHDAAIEDLGEEKLADLGVELGVRDLILYLASWNAKKIADAGGMESYERLTPQQKAETDAALMKEIVRDLGQAEYDNLADKDRRMIDLFIWAGCCMHKDQNSFKGGNTEMMAEWARINAEPPVLLANKGNAAILNRILDPSIRIDKLNEDQKAALEASTRGAVKAVALAGAIFNNKDDKKGQGDIHIDHFKECTHLLRSSTRHKRFPDTSNVRIGSHGLACCELISLLDEYISFLEGMKHAKHNPGHTNIEVNVLKALRDKATLTEMSAIVLYMNVISHPYMRVVRGPGTENVNALDLGPLHQKVEAHIRQILENPDVLFGPDASYETATLDGKAWHDPKAVETVFDMCSELVHLQAITLAFFRGSLSTWTRFSAEFAPGGLIDEATADEKQLAWMPSTNDANEGALGQLRVTLRNKPTLTLHQYNALAMYSRNQTISFMNALFEAEDHEFVMREARRIDSSGLAKKRRQEQVAFRTRIIQMSKEKEEAKKKRAQEICEKLASIPLIRSLTELNSSKTWTRKLLDDQLDALRYRKVTGIPSKSSISKVVEKKAALEKAFKEYERRLLELGRTHPDSLEVLELEFYVWDHITWSWIICIAFALSSQQSHKVGT